MQFRSLFPVLGSPVRDRSRVFQASGRIRHGAAIGSGLIAFVALTAATPPASGNITVTITDLRNTKGVVRACMTSDADTFPKCNKDPDAFRRVVSATDTTTVTFTNVKPGTYAIALLHDENDDGKANRVLGMMPKEGFGFSRDAKVSMGPPKYEDAVFEFTGEAQQMTVRMRYML